MPNTEFAQLTVQIGAGADANREEVDRLTRQLWNEIQDIGGIESVELVKGGQAPEGTKLADPLTLGALAVVVLPTVLPKLIEFLQAWAMRGQGRTVKFKGKVSGQDVEFEGTSDELKALLATLGAPPAEESKRMEKPE